MTPFQQEAAARSAWVRKRFPLDFPTMARSQNSASNPLIAVQARKARKITSLAGDPDSAVTVTQVNPYTVKKVCEYLLSALEPSERRWVKSGLSVSGDKHPVVPWFECIPSDATPDQTRKLLNGVGIALLSLGSAAGDTPTSTILQNASAMASRNLMASDPTTAVAPNETTLASLLLQAFTVDPELKERIAKSESFQRALRQCVEAAELMTANEAPTGGDPVEQEVFDCIKHNYPLGGKPLAGGVLKNLWNKGKDAWNKLTDSAEDKAKDKVDDAVGNLTGDMEEESAERKAKAAEYYNSRTMYWSSRYSNLYPTASAAEVQQMARHTAAKEAAARYGEAFEDPDQVLSGADGTGEMQEPGTFITPQTIATSQKALEDALAAIGSASQSMEEYREKAQKQAQYQARLLWAKAMLDSKDDVATILALTNPVTSSVEGFLNSALSVIPAAKKTGNVGTLRSLFKALRAATASGTFNDTELLSLLTGDPGEFGPTDSALSILAEAKGESVIQPAEESDPSPASDEVVTTESM